MYYAIFLLLVLLLPLRNIVLKVPNLFFGIDGFNLTNILFGILLLGIASAGKKEKTVVYSPKLQTPLVLFVLYFFLQIFLQPGFHSYERLFAWWKDAFLFMFILYFFVSKTITDTKKILIILAVMCVANLYMDIYFWRWVRWMSFDNFADKMKSVNGTFGDVGGCNEWAAFFSTYTLLIIALSSTFKRRLINISLKLLASANIIVLLFTFSRGGYAALIAGTTYLLIKARKYAYILLLLALPLCYTVVLPEAVVERIQMSFQKNDLGTVADQDVESRVVMWKEAVLMLKQSPVFGHGLLSFRYSHWRNPHNQHLNILVQGGIVGYLFFVWLFIAAFKDSNHLAQTGRNKFSRSFGAGMCAMTVSLFIGNLFGDRWSYYVLTGYFWILNGLVLVLINQSASSTSEPESLTQ